MTFYDFVWKYSIFYYNYVSDEIGRNKLPSMLICPIKPWKGIRTWTDRLTLALFAGTRDFIPKMVWRYVPKVHSTVMHWEPRPYVLLLPWPRRDFSLLTSRDRHIPTLAPAVQACFLCTVIFIFSFAEPREQSDITDPETVWRSERKRTVQQKIFMATRSIKLRRIYTPDGWFCQTLIPFKPAGFITPCE